MRAGGSALAAGVLAACSRSGAGAGDAATIRPVDHNQKDELKWLVWSTDERVGGRRRRDGQLAD